MAKTQKKKIRHTYNGIKFLIYPVIFFLLSAGLFWVALGPIVSPYLGMLDLFLLDTPLDFDSPEGNIFVVEDESSAEGTISYEHLNFPSYGDQYGKIVLPSLEVEAPLYYGDSPTQLRKGIGTYAGAYLPGQEHTILLAGHNDRYFRNLKALVQGDEVQIYTSYGVYSYKVTGLREARFDDRSAYDLDREEENLILYTCVKTASIGATPIRLFVYADYVSGPKLVW